MRSKINILLIIVISFLNFACYNNFKDKESAAKEYTSEQLDSLSFYGSHHYTKNYNFVVVSDSIRLLSQQPEEMLSDLQIDTFSVYKDDLIVVADKRIIPEDQIDSIWIQVAKDQNTFGWIHESEMLENVVPDDPISMFINVFSDTHLLIFLLFTVVVGAIFIAFKTNHKNVKMPYLNDIGSFYPILLCMTVAFSATFYATLQLFAPNMWEHFYFNPTLNPFSVPSPLNFFLASAWAIIIIGLATVDDMRRHLPIVESLLYMAILAVFCAINYVVFSISTLYYIGYPLLAVYIALSIWHFVKTCLKPYQCGNCGGLMHKKGRCPYCGTMNL